MAFYNIINIWQKFKMIWAYMVWITQTLTQIVPFHTYTYVLILIS